MNWELGGSTMSVDPGWNPDNEGFAPDHVGLGYIHRVLCPGCVTPGCPRPRGRGIEGPHS